MYFLGPKFTIFYNVYAGYELRQLALQWGDVVEEKQLNHLRHAKEQLEYVRINKEYEFIKKRCIVNFMTNEKLNLEKHFHQRALNMLSNIENFESQNLNHHIKSIADGAMDVVN